MVVHTLEERALVNDVVPMFQLKQQLLEGLLVKKALSVILRMIKRKPLGE